MNEVILELCNRLVPQAYITQGVQARATHEHVIKQLIEHVSRLFFFIVKS